MVLRVQKLLQSFHQKIRCPFKRLDRVGGINEKLYSDVDFFYYKEKWGSAITLQNFKILRGMALTGFTELANRKK